MTLRDTLVLIGLAAAAAVAPARADDCGAKATQAELDACAAATRKNTDADLNRTYRDILARLAGADDTKQLLIAAQRQWLLFRDAECAFAANAGKGGSIYPMIVENCRAGLTADRLKALGAYLHCAEGDMACPVPPK